MTTATLQAGDMVRYECDDATYRVVSTLESADVAMIQRVRKNGQVDRRQPSWGARFDRLTRIAD